MKEYEELLGGTVIGIVYEHSSNKLIIRATDGCDYEVPLFSYISLWSNAATYSVEGVWLQDD